MCPSDQDHLEMPGAGIVAVAVTPFTPAGKLDIASLETLMDFYIAAGVSGIALLGVMGEAHLMDDAESLALTQSAIKAIDGRTKVIVGVSDPALARIEMLTDYAVSEGAAGILVQPVRGLVGDANVGKYFATIAKHVGDEVPICVQDFPKANGVHISVDSWRMIVSETPSVVMLKHEEEPGLAKLTAIRAAEASGLRRVTILVGNNGIHLPQELARGADGGMTGFAFPDMLATVCELTAEGSPDEAMDLFDLYLPLNRHELRVGIAVRKEILRRRGVIASSYARYPASGLTREDTYELESLLNRLQRKTNHSLGQILTPGRPRVQPAEDNS